MAEDPVIVEGQNCNSNAEEETSEDENVIMVERISSPLWASVLYLLGALKTTASDSHVDDVIFYFKKLRGAYWQVLEWMLKVQPADAYH